MLHTSGINTVVLSPDTDVYYIGLPVVAVTNLNAIELVFLHHLMPTGHAGPCIYPIPQVIQAVLVSTGCDFVSFFTGVGKQIFLTLNMNTANSFVQTLMTCQEYFQAQLKVSFPLYDWLDVHATKSTNQLLYQLIQVLCLCSML